MELYSGFEQGPIRPPSEANSMLFRVTRNCSWNRCTFCSVYKDDKFSLRPVDDVIRDIDAVYHAIEKLKNNERKQNGAEGTIFSYKVEKKLIEMQKQLDDKEAEIIKLSNK